MIRLPHFPDARRARAAARLLDRRSPEIVHAEAATLLDEGAMREMERVWALSGAVADDPRIRAMLEEDLDRFQPVSRLRRFAPLAAALVLAFTSITAVGWFAYRETTPQLVATPGVSTTIGQRKRMVLADSSSVALDTDSEVVVAMSPRARNVTLRRGRAFFRVSKDPLRPFIVSAGDKRVRAVGTAFEVRIRGGQVLVTVVEGTVEVTERTPRPAATQSARIGPGTQLATEPDSNWTMRRVDPAISTIWLTGRLSFVDESLGSAVAEMNRYTRQKIVFRDGAPADARILGVFRAGDTHALAQAIELNGSARIVEVTPDRILVDPPGAPSSAAKRR